VLFFCCVDKRMCFEKNILIHYEDRVFMYEADMNIDYKNYQHINQMLKIIQSVYKSEDGF
jgi:hypothetical protein